ncbi:MAG: putative glycolipid-binding domain-containing protein [Micromonosporaceae bacterium]
MPPDAYLEPPTGTCPSLTRPSTASHYGCWSSSTPTRYEISAFDFTCRLVYDEGGLVLDYPGIAVRAG